MYIKGDKNTVADASIKQNLTKTGTPNHNERNLRIANIAGDDEFDPLKNTLKEKCKIDCNPTAADEHVEEVEQMI